MTMADEGHVTLILSHSAVCHLEDTAGFDMITDAIMSSAEEVLWRDNLVVEAALC